MAGHLPAPLRGVMSVWQGGTMKTTYRTRYGGSEILEIRDVPIPVPGRHEILVRVRATTVNRTDCGALRGRPYIFRFFVGWPRPRVVATGTDFAGEVVAIGPETSQFAVGDRVMGFNDNNLGSHAEYLCVPGRTAVAHIPEGVDFETAAASLEGVHYARTFIDKARLERGDRDLVYGATGGIGSAAVSLLRDAGMEVTAVCAEEHHEMAIARGAYRAIDYRTTPFTEQLQGETFACVLDAVGGSTFRACRPLLGRRGIYMSSELGPRGENPVLALCAPFMRGPKVRFPIPADIPRTLATIVPLLAAGRYRPLIDRRTVLDEIRETFAYVESARKIGNVLLIFP